MSQTHPRIADKIHCPVQVRVHYQVPTPQSWTRWWSSCLTLVNPRPTHNLTLTSTLRHSASCLSRCNGTTCGTLNHARVWRTLWLETLRYSDSPTVDGSQFCFSDLFRFFSNYFFQTSDGFAGIFSRFAFDLKLIRKIVTFPSVSHLGENFSLSLSFAD